MSFPCLRAIALQRAGVETGIHVPCLPTYRRGERPFAPTCMPDRFDRLPGGNQTMTALRLRPAVTGAGRRTSGDKNKTATKQDLPLTFNRV